MKGLPLSRNCPQRHRRLRLRADGLRVFQLTYADVKEWQRRVQDTGYAGAGPASPVWRPYGDESEKRARQYYANVRKGLPGELSETGWVNPADLLVAYLRDPSADRWLWRAEAAVAGLIGAGARGGPVDAVGEQIMWALGGAEPTVRPGERVQVYTAEDVSACRLVFAVDARNRRPRGQH